MKILRTGTRLAVRFLTDGALILWTFIAIVPFVLIVLLGLRNNTDIYQYPLGIGGSYHPENFVTAWEGPAGTVGLGILLLNTLIVMFVAAVVNVVLGALGAYFVTLLGRTASAVYLGLFIGGTIVPFVLILIPLFRALDAFGLLSNPPALGVVYGVLALPTTVLILTQFFAEFPRDLIEAASLDGLGDFSAFVRVVLPLSKGPLISVLLLLVVWVSSETQLAIVVLQNASSQTAAVGVLGFQGQFVSELGPLFAGLTIIAIPVVVLYLLLHRFITKGIALGGVFR